MGDRALGVGFSRTLLVENETCSSAAWERQPANVQRLPRARARAAKLNIVSLLKKLIPWALDLCALLPKAATFDVYLAKNS